MLCSMLTLFLAFAWCCEAHSLSARDLRLANSRRRSHHARGHSTKHKSSTAASASPKCIQRTITDDFTAFQPSIWTLDAGKSSQLSYRGGALNMTLTESSNNIVLATKKSFVPPVSFSIIMEPSSAPGIVSPAIFRGDATGTDEVDLEFVGGNPDSVQTVLWRLGKRVSFDLSNVDDVSPQTGYHNYTMDWTKTALSLSIDGQLIRTMVKPPTAGSNWPQGAQPLKFKMGPWASDAADWAGALNWTANPRPRMSVKSLTISGCATS